MGDFFAPPPGYPDLPPEPSTPPPNFTQIGEQFATGYFGSGTTGGWIAGLFEILLKWAAAVIGMLIAALAWLFAKAITIVDDALNETSAAYGTLVAATLKSLFGVEVSPASVSTRAGGPDRGALSQSLGKVITNTLFSAATALPGGGITPSDQAANNYLAVVMNMELNGWIESWFTDGITGHILEKYGELKDGIARVLGLGRMSRQVFAAPLNILVHQPYTQLLNQKFRPKLPAEGTVIRAFFNGEISEQQVSAMLALQGYTEQDIAWLINDHYKFLSLGDIDYLLGRGTWTQDDAAQYLGSMGYALNNTQHILAVMNDKRTFKYREQMVAVAEAAYVDGTMDLTTFQQIVNTLNLTQEETTWISNLATLKRSVKVTHLSLGQIEQGIKDGILSFVDLQQWAARVNMPAYDLANLELMIQFQINKASATATAKAAAAKAKATAAQAKAAAAAQKAAQAKALAPDKGVTVAQAETLVEDGLWTFQQLTAFLTAKQYGADAIDAIVSLLHTKLATKAAGAATKATVATALGAKGLSLAETEKAVVAGILTIADLEAFLTAHGFDAADSTVIVDLTEQAVASAQAKAAAKSAATVKASEKQLSLPELEKAVRLGLTTMAAYNTALKAAGFEPMSITLLDGLLQAQIDADKATAAKQAGSAAASAVKGISLPQLEQEVINGIRPIADYQAALVKLNYSPTDQTDLVELLQLKVDQAKVTAAKKAAAAAALDARGISLVQAENAVKLGVIPVKTYSDMLTAQHFTPDAIDILTSSLLAELAKVKKTAAAAAGDTTAAAAKGISLADIEKAVIAGIDPIATYTAALTKAGYSAGDAQTLTELLQLKVDVANATKAAHADAEGRATQKGISLGKEESAVIAGDLTMADYDALLSKLGYDAVDRGILEQLLQTKVNAAAAKAGSTTPTQGGGTTSSS
jgi:hypothetical protein